MNESQWCINVVNVYILYHLVIKLKISSISSPLWSSWRWCILIDEYRSVKRHANTLSCRCHVFLAGPGLNACLSVDRKRGVRGWNLNMQQSTTVLLWMFRHQSPQSDAVAGSNEAIQILRQRLMVIIFQTPFSPGKYVVFWFQFHWSSIQVFNYLFAIIGSEYGLLLPDSALDKMCYIFSSTLLKYFSLNEFYSTVASWRRG